MNRPNEWHQGLLATLFNRASPSDVAEDDELAHDLPELGLDHPTYLRRGIAIPGMALPARVRYSVGVN